MWSATAICRHQSLRHECRTLRVAIDASSSASFETSRFASFLLSRRSEVATREFEHRHLREAQTTGPGRTDACADAEAQMTGPS